MHMSDTAETITPTRGARKRILAMALIAWLFNFPTVSAQQVLAPRAPLVEDLKPRAPLSGGELLGFFVSPPDAGVDITQLWLYTASQPGALACMVLRSIDGRYVAHADFDTRTIASGWHRLVLRTGYPDTLNQWNAEQLAAIAWIGRSCDFRELEQAPTLLPLRWGTRVAAEASVLLNSARVDARVLIPAKASCPWTSSLPRTVYDRRCTVSLTSGSSTVRIQLYEFETPLSTISFTTSLP
jgi:hypothetical protein